MPQHIIAQRCDKAVTVRITPVSERPRLLSVGSSYESSSAAAPSSSRSFHSGTMMEPASASIPPPLDLTAPTTRYLPVRTHSSPASVPMADMPLITTYIPRPPLIRAPASSRATSPTCTDSPYFSPLRSHAPTPWDFPAGSCSYSVSCTHDDSSERSSSTSTGRPRLHPSTRSASSMSAASTSSSLNGRKGGSKDQSHKRRRRGASSTDPAEEARGGKHGDEFLFEGFGAWFKRMWKE